MPVVCVCGRVAGAGEIECSLCGRDLTGPPSAPPDAWPSAPAPASYPVAPTPHRSERSNLAPILIGALVLVLTVGALLFFLNRPGPAANPSPIPAEPAAGETSPPVDSYSPAPAESETTETSESPASVGYPDVTITGQECGRKGHGPYAAAAKGNDDTSCPFAMNVGKAYRGHGSKGDPVTLYVYSPHTGDWYYMDCSGDQPVTCVNTTNAVVYLYGGHANFSE